MLRRVLLAVGLAFVIAPTLISCSPQPALQTKVPDRLTLYSIDYHGSEPGQPPIPPSAEKFRGYQVLGKVSIDDPKRRQALMAAFDRGVASSDGTMAKCFWPRHAIQVEQDGKTTDYVICFECLQFHKMEGGNEQTIAIDSSPLEIFNAELKRAGVPLAPSALKGSE